jgi:hypothetical protein
LLCSARAAGDAAHALRHWPHSETPPEKPTPLNVDVSPEERLSLLKKGRGLGYLAALKAGPAAIPDIISCVINDPREDKQIESRREYYANLLRLLAADISPIARHVAAAPTDTQGSDFWLAEGVLTTFAERGDQAAVEGLTACLCHPGAYADTLGRLESLKDVDLVRAVVTSAAAGALRRFAEQDEDFMRVASNIKDSWPDMATLVPVIGEYAARYPIRPPAAATDAAPAQTEVRDHPETASRMIAVLCDVSPEHSNCATLSERFDYAKALGSIGNVELIGHIEAYFESQKGRSADELVEGFWQTLRVYRNYVEALPIEIRLPIARRWYQRAYPFKPLANSILREHATPEDRPLVEAIATREVDAGCWWYAHSDIHILYAIHSVLSASLFARVYEGTTYAFGRYYTTRYFADFPHLQGAREYLTEALWDCEDSTRETACRAADPSDPFIRARLEELAADIFEDEKVREAAAETLKRA